MKNKLIATAGILLGCMAGIQLNAGGCAGTVPVYTGNSFNLGTVAQIPGAVGAAANVRGYLWLAGNSATYNYNLGGGAGLCTIDKWFKSSDVNFGNPATVYGMPYPDGTSEGADWSNPCTIATPAGCAALLVPTNRMAMFVNFASSGNLNGKYILASVLTAQDGNGGISFNKITNGTASTNGTVACADPPLSGATSCIATPVAIPTALVQTVGGGATYNHATGAGSVLVTFPKPNVNGYFDSAPGSPLITAINVYEQMGAAPVTSLISSWTSAGSFDPAVDCPAGTCSKLITLPTTVTGSNKGYLALGLVIDGGAVTSDWLSTPSAGIGGPLAVDGLPTSVEAYNTKVGNLPGVQLRWTSTNESDIAGYNVLASREDSTFVKVNEKLIATAGAGTYTQNVTRRTLQSKVGASNSYLVKVQVVMRDGSTQDVGPATYSFK